MRIAAPRFYFAGILSVLGGLLLWELVSRFLVANALFLAAPSQIFAAIVALARSGELWRHMCDQRDRVRARLRHRERARRGHRLRHGRKRHHEAGAAAVDFGPLRHADHRARAAVHSLARDRHLVEGAGGHLPRAVSGHHQHRGGAAHHQRAADRDAALVRRDARGRFSSRCRCRRRCLSSSPASSSASAAA